MHENDIYNNGKRMNLLKLLVDYNRLKSRSNEVKFKKPKHDFELLVSKKTDFILFIKANCKDRWSTKAEQKK